MRKKTLILLVLIAAIIIGIAVWAALYEPTTIPRGGISTSRTISNRGTINYGEIIFSLLALMPL